LIGAVKYFFLSEGWTYNRVWEFGGLWDEFSWGRKPHLQRLNCGILQQDEVLWLYAVEDAVLMVEVNLRNKAQADNSIGQVVLKRLISAEQVIEIITSSESLFNSAASK